jgi:hypothetical protein
MNGQDNILGRSALKMRTHGKPYVVSM